MNKSRSYFLLGILVGCLCAGLLFAGISRRAAQGGGSSARVLNFGHSLPPTHPINMGAMKMAERLEELSHGTLKMNVFPSSQLGDETRRLERLQAGTLAFSQSSAAPFGNFVSAFRIFSLPYLFRSDEHYWHVLNGKVGQDLLDAAATRDDGQPSGLIGIGYFDAGSRSFYATRPLNGPKDLRGLKIRVMGDPVAMDMVSALGASPAVVPFGELYGALQQGVVDGAENNPPSIVSTRHYEVTQYLMLDEHSRIPDMVVMSAKVWNSLTPEQQGWVKQAMQDATAYQREIWTKSTADALQTLRKAGMHIVDVDPAPFEAATRPVVEKYATGDVRKFYDAIKSTQ